MLEAEYSLVSPYDLTQPLRVLPFSFFLLLHLANVQLFRFQDWIRQGFDSLGSSYAYKTNSAQA